MTKKSDSVLRRTGPWRTVRRYFLTYGLIVCCLVVVVAHSLRYSVYRNFSPSPEFESPLLEFDKQATDLVTLALLVGIVAVGISSYRHARPLGRLLKRIHQFRLEREPVGDLEGEAGERESADWTELERAMSRLFADLRTRSRDLQKEREELATVLGAVSDAIIAVDLRGVPLFYNAPYAIIFGGPAEINRPLKGLREAFRSPDLLQGFELALSSGQAESLIVGLHTHVHRGLRQFQTAISPLRSREGGEIWGAVGIFHDITELKAAEQIRTDFVANASHELKTPLTSIKGYIDAARADLQEGRTGSDVLPLLDVAQRNVDRMILLVNDLLDLSVLDSGAPVEKAIISTLEVTENSMRQLEKKRIARHQTIHVECRAPHVLADARRVEQVLVNLVENAIKYSPEGGDIRVLWEARGSDILLRVRDNGPGIPPEALPRLFERFYRVDAGRAREVGGTGLGLAIVKHIMGAHGGKVSVDSSLGHGSEFICSFPLR